MTLKDALQLLELSVPFTKAELKKAYGQALKVWHPDRFAPGDELHAKAQEKTRLIIEAFECLSRAMGGNDSYPPPQHSESNAPPQPPPSSRTGAAAPEPRTPNPQPAASDDARSRRASASPGTSSASPPEHPPIGALGVWLRKHPLLVIAWLVPLIAFPTSSQGIYDEHKVGEVLYTWQLDPEDYNYSMHFPRRGTLVAYSPIVLTFVYAKPADLFLKNGYPRGGYTLNPHWKYWFCWIGGALALTAYSTKRRTSEDGSSTPRTGVDR